MSLLGLGIGMGIGGAAGALEGIGNYAAKANARDFLKQGKRSADAQYDALIEAMQGQASGYGQTADQMLAEILAAQQAPSTTYKASQYTARDLGNATEALLNPAMAQVNAQTRKALENSAAGRGQLLSGATQKAIADRVAANTAQMYADARNAALQQAAQDLSAFQANEAAKQTQASQATQSKQFDINSLLGLYNSNLSASRGASAQATNLGAGKIAADTQYYRDRAGLGNANPSGLAMDITAGVAGGLLPGVAELGKLL